jgi:hypothetical protein
VESLRSATDAEARLLSNDGEVLRVDQVERPDFPRAENWSYNSVQISQVDIGYRILAGKLTPVFHFTGSARNADGKLLQVQMAVSALR